MFALTPHADIGNVRETFFMNQLSQSHELCYPKTGDFMVDGKYLFEIFCLILEIFFLTSYFISTIIELNY